MADEGLISYIRWVLRTYGHAEQTSKTPLLDAVEALRTNTYRLAPGECVYCDQYRDDAMMPSHTPSANCASGKRPHCTCDVCF